MAERLRLRRGGEMTDHTQRKEAESPVSGGRKRLVIGVSGASGIPLAEAVLRHVREIPDLESWLVMTRGAELTLRQESGLSLNRFQSLADVVLDNSDIGAGPASGTFETVGMVIVPCSMKTIAGIWSGYSDNLLLRAADVTLKERRPLILAARESPLSEIHLRNLYELSRMGAIIVPPMVSFYEKNDSLKAYADRFAARLLTYFGIHQEQDYHWQGMGEG